MFVRNITNFLVNKLSLKLHLIWTKKKTSLLFISSVLQVGKAEFLGRAIGKPNVLLCEETYKAPSLEWFQIFRGTDEAGELLAAFEMFEVNFLYQGSLNKYNIEWRLKFYRKSRGLYSVEDLMNVIKHMRESSKGL